MTNKHKNERLNIARQAATEKNGRCLSDQYQNAKTKMNWECSAGHRWMASFSSVVSEKTWCLECFKKTQSLPNGLTIAQETAKTRNGKCLSTEYENIKSVMTWQCEKGHIWDAPFRSVFHSNRWCRQCSTNKQRREGGIELAHNYAKSKNGKCLDEKYVNSYHQMTWQCEHDHVWKSTFQTVVSHKGWCPYCNGKTADSELDSIEYAKKYAVSRGGECKSTIYKGVNGKLTWKCHDPSHNEWSAIYRSVVKKNTWCPQCKNHNNVNEHRAVKIIEYLLNLRLVKSKPKWNVNKKTGRLLELDGYDDAKKIAVEFQGEQHFMPNVFPYADLRKIQERDAQKVINCENNNVKLIRVFILPFKDQGNFNLFMAEIYRAIDEISLAIDKSIDSQVLKNIFYKPIGNKFQKEQFDVAELHAKSKNGKLLSESYQNRTAPMLWKCHNHLHEPFSSAFERTVKRNVWCPQCSIEKSTDNKQISHQKKTGINYIELRKRLKEIDTTRMTLNEIAQVLDTTCEPKTLYWQLNCMKKGFKTAHGKPSRWASNL
ncbi:hypothetical protein [Burkholderia cenocepacia]|uniref:hypothetical protein n=1 Tax=Burkholderia cenocepacia TaxID=95486 RepID=UPI001177B731|nr:hypothetical protein [Burkholderia cenocepacia]